MRRLILLTMLVWLAASPANAQIAQTFTIPLNACVIVNGIQIDGVPGECQTPTATNPAPGAGTIEAPGDTDVYQFNATAGQRVFIEPRAYAGLEAPVRWQVIAPSGAVLFDDLLTARRGEAPPRQDLTETGIHQIIVGAGGTEIGTYEFALWAVPNPPVTAIDPALGETLTAQLPTPGAEAVYTFNAVPGQLFTVSIITACCSVGFVEDARWRLVAPSGAEVFDLPVPPNFLSDRIFVPVDGESFPLEDPEGVGFRALPEAGTYRVIIGNPDNPSTGNVTLAPQFAAPRSFDIDPNRVFVLGDGQTGLPPNLSETAYRFNATAGDPLRLSLGTFFVLANGQENVRWEIITPSGAQIYDRAMVNARDRTESLTLPETGTYTLRVYPLQAVVALFSFQIETRPDSGLLPIINYPLPGGQTGLQIDAGLGLLARQGLQGTASLITNSLFGDVIVNADGSFSYELLPDSPDTSVTGFEDSFSYQIDTADGRQLQGIAEINLQENLRIQNDLYRVFIGEGALDIPASRGVLANDTGVTRATLTRMPENGTLDFREDGSFTYTPNPGFSGIDQFTYVDADDPGSDVGTALLAVRQSNVFVNAPPQLFTPQDTPLPIDNVEIQSTADQVEVTLQVDNGSLNVQNTTVIQPQQVGPPPPTITGNGSGSVTITGARDSVNAALDTLVYTPNRGFVGVDNLVIVATTLDRSASDSRTVIIRVGEDGDVAVSEGTASTAAASDRLALLTTLSAEPGTIIRGTVPPGAVPGGDVYVRILANSGDLLVPVAELGDTTLVELGILNSAEVFGLNPGGVTVPEFAADVEVCLRGGGNFFYRDATGVPRTTQQLNTSTDGDFTCADIPNSGTVILIGGGLTLTDTGASAVELTNCMVTTRAILNLREEPTLTSRIIRPMPFNVTLTALQRQANWFYVDYLGTFGWASGDFLSFEGDC